MLEKRVFFSLDSLKKNHPIGMAVCYRITGAQVHADQGNNIYVSSLIQKLTLYMIA